MKAYGVSRHYALVCPDCVDVTVYGLPSKHGKRKSKTKRANRRIWKKKERAVAKKLCKMGESDEGE